MEDKISIIIPVYNVEKYVAQCIRSVCDQTYNNLEIIVINDGSSDNSHEICVDFARRDDRIVYIKKENGGVVSAWAEGIKTATGTYVAFVDGDDYVTENYIDGMVKALDENPDVTIVAENAVRLESNGKTSEWIINSRVGIVEFDDKYRLSMLTDEGGKIQQVGCTRWGKLIKRDVLVGAAEFCDNRVSFGDDQMLIASLVLLGGKAVCIKNFDYVYRKADESITQGFKKDIFDKFMLLDESIGNLPNFHDISNAQLQLNTFLVTSLCDALLHYAKYKQPIANKVSEYLANERVKEAIENCYTRKMSKRVALIYKALKSYKPKKIERTAKFANWYINLMNRGF